VGQEKKPKPDKSWSAVSLAWELGYTITIPLVALALLGRFLDKKMETSPWIFLGGILLAVIVSSCLVYRKTKKIIEF